MADAASLQKHADNKKIADNLNDDFPSPYTEKNAVEFIGRLKSDDPPRILAITYEDSVIGAIGLFPQTRVQRLNAEIGYWVAEEYWNRGIASLALKAMVNYGFEQFDIIRIYARPFPFNSASRKVLEKNGFKLEAVLKKGLVKNNEVFDELIYSCLKENRP